jgi:hypothetical protein
MYSPGLFIRRLLQVTALVVFTVASLLFFLQPDPNHYYQASVLKSRLLQQTRAPRIILVGGSNIAWGIDSELIERELRLPAINAGLDFHIGISPLIELREYMQPGDIIVVSLEYYNFTGPDDFFGIPQYQADWIEFSPRRIMYLHNPYREALPMLTMILQRKINRELNNYLYHANLNEFRGIYTSRHFNAHGDFIGHLGADTSPGMIAEFGGFPVNQVDEAFDFLHELNQFAVQHGAVVFYEAPAARQTNCDLTGEKYLRRFYNVLRARTDIPLLTSMDSLCYPDEYFFDTPYHLNLEGRQVRTEHLIENLRAALAEIR